MIVGEQSSRLLCRLGLFLLLFTWIAGHSARASAAIPARATDDAWYASVAINAGYVPSIGCNMDPYGYCLRNCTSYVAYRLRAAGAKPQRLSYPGNAIDWFGRARSRGIAVGSTPRVGAVAYQGAESNPYGHVSFVTAVHADGSINTRSYNGYTERPFFEYGTRAYSKFIYFSNVGLPAKATTVSYGRFAGSALAAGQALRPGQYLASKNRLVTLAMQKDGNLVLRSSRTVLWSSRTAGSGADRLVMQSDGNLVLYDARVPKWSSGTNGFASGRLAVQSDGNLVIYASSRPLWWTGTRSKL